MKKKGTITLISSHSRQRERESTIPPIALLLLCRRVLLSWVAQSLNISLYKCPRLKMTLSTRLISSANQLKSVFIVKSYIYHLMFIFRYFVVNETISTVSEDKVKTVLNLKVNYDRSNKSLV